MEYDFTYAVLHYDGGVEIKKVKTDRKILDDSFFIDDVGKGPGEHKNGVCPVAEESGFANFAIISDFLLGDDKEIDDFEEYYNKNASLFATGEKLYGDCVLCRIVPSEYMEFEDCYGLVSLTEEDIGEIEVVIAWEGES